LYAVRGAVSFDDLDYSISSFRFVAEDGCAALDSRHKTISVFFIGNSLTSGVPNKVERLLVCGGYTAEIEQSNPGGYKLYQHKDLEVTNNTLAKGFQKVVLQEQSAGMHYWHKIPYPHIQSLKDKIDATGGEMIFYQTWGYDRFPPDDHINGYDQVGAYFDTQVVAVGRAWKMFDNNYEWSKPFELFSDDRHASGHGQSLAAYVFYAYLTGHSPVGLSSLSLSDSDAAILQDIAWQIYQGYP
jgi:hypothetical protein